MNHDPIEVLRNAHRIAVVGASATPGKDAHEVPRGLIEKGYDIIPVNPTAPEIFGRKAYKALADVPGEIDLVNVFRPSNEAPDIVRQAIERGAKAVWLQSGLRSEEAAALARRAGLTYIEDACTRTVAAYL